MNYGLDQHRGRKKLAQRLAAKRTGTGGAKLPHYDTGGAKLPSTERQYPGTMHLLKPPKRRTGQLLP